MAAAQLSVGGLPTETIASRRSFADVLAAKPTASASSPQDPYAADPLKMGLHKGLPAAFFTDSQLQGLSSPYSWSLVGKFSQGFNKSEPNKGRPSLDNLHQFFLTLDFKGEFSLGLLDNRHVIIHLSNEADYLRLYSRMVWYIGPVTMRVFRWSPYFRVDKESSLVPVWITMPRLPIMLFDQTTLLSLASLIGRPLRRDDATITLKRPSVARVQVEVDLLKPRPDRIWIGLGASDGYWQKIEYESIPDYCQKCWHVGHAEEFCRMDQPVPKPQPRQATVPVSAVLQRLNQKYVPKNPQAAECIPSEVLPPLTDPIPAAAVVSAIADVPPVPVVSMPSASAGAQSVPDVPIPSLVVTEVGFPSRPVDFHAPSLPPVAAISSVVAADPSALVAIPGPSCVRPVDIVDSAPEVEETLAVVDSPVAVTYADILQGSTPSSSLIIPVPDFNAHPVTPMIDNIDGMSSDDDVSPYPFLLPTLITDDTSIYRRKLHEDVVKARSDSTKVLIAKPRAELLAEFEEFNACMRSKAVQDLAQHPVSQDILPLDDKLTDINVEDGDFADGFITVRPKNRGRGRPRKHKK